MALKNKTTENKPKRTPFAVVESYNTIRTNILFSLSQNNGKIFTISSANESEGKSTTAVNTAIAFSQLGSKTLLIDADMRKPSIHKKIHIANTKGLSNVLVGFCTFDEAVNEINPNLDVLTAGPTPPNPSEMLAGQNIEKLLETLKEKYDYIIFDTPPINIVSDAVVIAPKTDGLVIVIKDSYTYHEEFKSCLSSVEFANVRLLGVVLNAVNPKNSTKYKYKYRYRYKYRYMSYKGYRDSQYVRK
ncbi:MAG: CpsD/CapB family tyrosine-protein kinase [Ruminococcaceae bacterium]|nr:CpsD/CapB family tyrosine-protein kinase [Oscillospiraceae bacterium]